LRRSKIVHETTSADGTAKFLISLESGGAVETVLMPSFRDDRAMGCVSSQIGCAMGCDFCASTKHGLERNLQAGEIIEQFLHLREQGAMRSAAVSGEIDVDEVVAAVQAQPAMAGAALVAGVSTNERYTFAAEGAVRVAVVDYGCKRSVLRRLAASGAAVDVFPHDVDADSLAGYDGVLLSPGPGDPAPLVGEAKTLQDLLGRTPVLGVCLGHQLLALATGRETFKLPFGHRGANHPVLDHRSRRVLVTSQNHGFAVAAGDDQGAYVALRRHRRRPRVPGRARALGAVPPGSSPWAARRRFDHRPLGRRTEAGCMRGST